MKWSRVADVIGFALTTYVLVTGYVGVPPSLQHRPLAAGVILLLVFLTTDHRGRRTEKPGAVSILLGSVSLIASLFVTLNYHWFLARFPLVTPLKPAELVCGVVLIVLVLEAGRRTLGWALPALSIVALGYGAFGHLLPGILHHTFLSFNTVIDDLYTTTEGLWGSPTQCAVTFVFMFVIFGALLGSTGLGTFFVDVARSLTGRFSGGPAKASVVSSALLGMIEGSSVTNVVTDGVFTIPAMKRYGFPDYFAGGVEAASSCGGQITPPILGAAAFIMAEFTGIPYIQIAKHAIIPAVLYFVSVFAQIHLKAKKLGMKGLPQSDIPPLWPILKAQGALLFPIAMLVWLLAEGYSPMRAGFVSVVAILAVTALTVRNPKRLASMAGEAFVSAPRQMCSIGAAVLNAGIVIGVLQLTGLGLRLSSLIIEASHGSLPLALMYTTGMAVILGMGIPTSGAYIIMGTLLAPGLVRMGMMPIQAHMFVFYFACMSMITPPVAIASYAAAAIAGANPGKVGLAAWRLALAAFVVPFMFAYSPELLGIGSALGILRAFSTAFLGCVFLACAIESRIFHDSTWWERVLMAGAALLLIDSGLMTDVIGLGLAMIAVLAQRGRLRRSQVLTS